MISCSCLTYQHSVDWRNSLPYISITLPSWTRPVLHVPSCPPAPARRYPDTSARLVTDIHQLHSDQNGFCPFWTFCWEEVTQAGRRDHTPTTFVKHDLMRFNFGFHQHEGISCSECITWLFLKLTHRCSKLDSRTTSTNNPATPRHEMSLGRFMYQLA